MDQNSAEGPDGIPAMFLIKTKEAITDPMAKMLRKSLDEGKISDILKMAYEFCKAKEKNLGFC